MLNFHINLKLILYCLCNCGWVCMHKKGKVHLWQITHVFMKYDKKQAVGWCVLYVYISVKTKTNSYTLFYIWKWVWKDILGTWRVPVRCCSEWAWGEARGGRLAFSSRIIVFFYLVQKVTILCDLKDGKERKNVMVSVSNKVSNSGHGSVHKIWGWDYNSLHMQMKRLLE